MGFVYDDARGQAIGLQSPNMNGSGAPPGENPMFPMNLTRRAVGGIALGTLWLWSPAVVATVQVAITPTSAIVQAGIGTQPFTATVTGTTHTGVTWQVNGTSGGSATVGTISSSGVYTAPSSVPSPATVVVRAVSVAAPARSASARVTVTAPVAVTVSPAATSVPTGATTTFTAKVAHSTNTAVTWQVNGVPGGGSTTGTITTAGVYQAPAVVPSPAAVTVTAVSVADPSRSASATVTVIQAVSMIAPRTAALTSAQTQQFTAVLAGGGPTTWTATGGTISATGLYVPDGTAGTYTVTASNGTSSVTANVAVTTLAGVYTYHNDLGRTGQNLEEYALTPATVSSGSFGKRWSCALDAPAYAQPLYVANLAIGGGTHNVVIVATQNDTVYAFDADAPSCVTYWKTSFLSAGVTAVPGQAVGSRCVDIKGTYGITGTPVIDPATGMLFLVAATQTTATQAITQTLHALDLATGTDVVTPQTIAAAAIGSSPAFSALYQNQRAGLALYNGGIFIAWASHCDTQPYNGWVMLYNEALEQLATFNATPNGSEAGIWMSGGAPVVDSTPRLFFSTGNGSFNDTNDQLPAPSDSFGESFLALDPASLGVVDYYTPSAEAAWSNADLDISSAGVLALPDGAGPSGHPNVLVGGSKQGYFWMIDRTAMSLYSSTGNNTVQFLKLPGTSACGQCLYTTPAYWNGAVYVNAIGGPVLELQLASGLLPATPTTSGNPPAATAVPTSQSAEIYKFPGATPSVSASGATNGLLWTLDNNANGTNNGSAPLGPAILRAYDATNLATTLYSSATLPADTGGNAVKFMVPVIANGHVYVAGASQLTVYGLAP